jgi:hypothetical protein
LRAPFKVLLVNGNDLEVSTITMTVTNRAGRRRRRATLPGLLAVAALLGSLGMSAPAGAALVTSNCADSVIAARGTDVPSPKKRNGRVWEGAGYGPLLARLTKRYADSPAKVNTMGLVFPANGGIDYAASVNTGVNNLGHSQGAQIILDALSSARMSSGALSLIQAVAVFGDPTYLDKRAINAPSNPVGSGIFFRSTASRKWLDNYKTPGRMGGKQKIRSWCYKRDINSPLTGNFEVHSSYLNTEKRRDATLNWIASLP